VVRFADDHQLLVVVIPVTVALAFISLGIAWLRRGR
jgi:hypothetical protein